MLTPELVELHFRQRCKRGAIVRFEMPCDDPNRAVRNKFGVVLNLDPADSGILLAITTTNQSFFASPFVANDTLQIEAGSYPCFPQPTIISFRDVKEFQISWMKRRCMESKLKFEGELSDMDITEMDQKLSNSALIEGIVLKRIVR